MIFPISYLTYSGNVNTDINMFKLEDYLIFSAYDQFLFHQKDNKKHSDVCCSRVK